jgi:signal peptidase I
LSNTFNDQQDQSNTPESNFDDSTRPNRQVADHSDVPEPPLPDFDSLPAENARPFKASTANSQNLDDFLSAQRSGEPVEQPTRPVSNPFYRVSSAGSDLSNYTMPMLDEPLPEKDTPSTWQAAWSIMREVGETVILTLIIFFVIQMFIRNFRVVGTSMVNNLQNGQYLIIDKVSYNPFLMDYLGIGGPTRGDVIVFKPPRYPSEDYVKRIIGLSGEKVQVIKGQVYINDQLLEEPFQPIHGSYTMPAPLVVPEGQVFVLGDNRNNSNDSHNWGPLPIENIVGRAWVSYWPPDQWGLIPRDTPTEEATLWNFLGDVIPSANAKNE